MSANHLHHLRPRQHAPLGWALAALITTLMAFGMSACGSSDDDPSPSTDALADSETATTPLGRDMTPPVASEALDADWLPPDNATATLPATLRPPP